ncbi:unnamed protein product [Schistosoma intercalatum]|nr:unnamed protein product [Schistosoma intercalatum]CAH8596590.1 unnamed protein product [Schistosoma intercalatum]
MQQHLIFSFYTIFFLYKLILAIELTKDLDYLLKAHNRIRQNARDCNITGQPQAKRLPNLIWDNELALKAAALSKTCNFRFSNVTTKKFKDVGQNIAAYASVEIAMNEWVNEHNHYNFDNNTCTTSCGNYVQIVWHGTTHIGCGVTYCPKTRRFPYGVFVVCNYAPGAKFNRSPYDVVSYAKCPTGQWKWKQFNLNGENCYCYL